MPIINQQPLFYRRNKRSDFADLTADVVAQLQNCQERMKLLKVNDTKGLHHIGDVGMVDITLDRPLCDQTIRLTRAADQSVETLGSSGFARSELEDECLKTVH